MKQSNIHLDQQKQTTKNELNEKKQQLTKIYPQQLKLIRTNYDYSRRVQAVNNEPSMTVQDTKDECDVNKILERFERTGVLEHTKNVQPQYGDFTDIPDYQESLNMALQAQNMFMDLPAHIREKFQNDAFTFLKFANDPQNQEAMIDMGLATRRTSPADQQSQPPEGKASSGEKKSGKAAPDAKSE